MFRHIKYNYFAKLIFLIVVLFIFKDILVHKGAVIFNLGGDGIKNIFTYIFHVTYEHGAWFHGMNYPYGDPIVFTDNVPFLSYPLSFINSWLHFSPAALLQIYYGLMMVNYWLAMYYVYKILRVYQVTNFIAIISGCLIIIQSANTLRITDEYSLSYNALIPMVFYWSILYFKTYQRSNLFKIVISILCFAFIHLYFLGMMLIWIGCYSLFFLITILKRTKKEIIANTLYIISFIVAVAIVFLMVKLTDPVTDRPVFPYTGDTSLNFLHLFTQNISPIWEWINSIKSLNILNHPVDDVVYIPVSVTLLLVFSIFFKAYSKFKGEIYTLQFDPIWLWTAILGLLFAMTIKHIWNYPLLKSILTPFRQFREPERLSWEFYFILCFYAVLVLEFVFQYLKRKNVTRAYVLVTIILGLWVIDANGFIINVRKSTTNISQKYNSFFYKDELSFNDFLKQHHFNKDDFQCVFALHYVDIGSEKIWLNENRSVSIFSSFPIAYNTGLPMMDVMMSRTSWSQTFDQVKICAGPYVKKPILYELNSKKILLLQYDNDLDEDELFLTESALKIGDFHGFKVFAFSPQQLINKQKILANTIQKIADIQTQQDSIIGEPGSVYINHFNNHLFKTNFADSSGCTLTINHDTTLITWKIPSLKDSMFECSGWFKVPANNYSSNYYTIIYKKQNGDEISRQDVFGKYSVDNEPGYWFRVSTYFKTPPNCAKIDIVLHPDLLNSPKIIFDEFIIRPADAIVITKFNNGVKMVNNHVLHPF